MAGRCFHTVTFDTMHEAPLSELFSSTKELASGHSCLLAHSRDHMATQSLSPPPPSQLQLTDESAKLGKHKGAFALGRRKHCAIENTFSSPPPPLSSFDAVATNQKIPSDDGHLETSQYSLPDEDTRTPR